MNISLSDFLYFKIINLTHREDRRNESITELEKANFLTSTYSFHNAKYCEGIGILGCSISHAMVLSDFLWNSDKPYALILEDDFSIQDHNNFTDQIIKILQNANIWDVFLLGHNQALPIENTVIPNTFRVVNSQTASGYIVSRNYVHKLIDSFNQSVIYITYAKSINEPFRKKLIHLSASDILWKRIQLDDRFLASFPALIKQRVSFSDIENKIVDYGV